MTTQLAEGENAGAAMTSDTLMRRLFTTLTTHRSSRGHALWVVIGRLLNVSMVPARQICRQFGHEPDVRVKALFK